MDFIFEKTIMIQDYDVNQTGVLKLSALLRYVQEVSGGHSDQLGFTWETLAENGLFWAVLRHKAVVHRLPKSGEVIHFQTWPMPATRSAYPRAVRAVDAQGDVLFETVSLWVLMNIQTRTMVLPGKSGVDVPGVIRGIEIPSPGSIPPGDYSQSAQWTVDRSDLDINGHVNNAKYLDHVENLLEHTALCVQEITVCYLAETFLGQEITLRWNLTEEGVLYVDGVRSRTDVHGGTERVFAVKLSCSVNQSEL